MARINIYGTRRVFSLFVLRGACIEKKLVLHGGLHILALRFSAQLNLATQFYVHTECTLWGQ